MTTSQSSSPAPEKNSDSGGPSTKPTLTPLQTLLQQQQAAADLAAKESLIQHEQRLSEAMTAALDTFKKDISSRKRWLLMNLIGWPILTLILCTALAGFGVWGWWKMNRPYEIKPYTDQQGQSVQMKVLKENYPNTCPTPAGERRCKPLEP